MANYFEKALLAKLANAPAIADLVADRVFPQRTPQVKGRPSLTVWCKDALDLARSMDDAGNLCQSVYQLDCWSDAATGYDDVKTLAEALRNVIDQTFPCCPNWWTFTGGQFWILLCEIENNTDDYAAPAFSDDTGTHAVSMNLTVVYDRDLATG